MEGRIPVVAILDVGKTNKKAFLFDEEYRIVHEQSTQLEETTDEDGFPCEDVVELRRWIGEFYQSILRSTEFEVVALNASAYGASFVHLDKLGKVLTPLSNYLKPYPEKLKQTFYRTYGGEESVSLRTASPVLGSLNSGLQLYRLKKERPNYFTQVNNSLHLPQFVTWAITGQAWSEITSIGCHTHLWDFPAKKYHDWVAAEGVDKKLPEVFHSDGVLQVKAGNREVKTGVGLHDSSAALIPYLAQFKGHFLLLSTGTWCITLNPFSQSPLTADELNNDCLCYLDYKGNPVKASRLFAGHEHEQQTKRLAEHFHVGQDYFKQVEYNSEIAATLSSTRGSAIGKEKPTGGGTSIYHSAFAYRDVSSFANYEEAYHQLMIDITADQAIATRRVVDPNGKMERLFVDGGFSNNPLFMKLLAAHFPTTKLYSASLHQASALGAALAIHRHWNKREEPVNLIQLSEL